MGIRMKLRYYKGTILVDGEYSIPYTKWDERAGCYRALALDYREILEYLQNSKILYEDAVLDLIPCPNLSGGIKLRDYQLEALDQWMKQKKGVIVLPTGSGKTVLAIKIIEKMNVPSFIIVPTLDLVIQWRDRLEEAFNIKIGEYTGERKDLQPITVSTYESAYLNAEWLGNKFKLLIFDEVHHLPAEGYRQIAEMFAAPYRLGLTATYKREDELHKELPRLIGGIIYELEPQKLVGTYLAHYETVRLEIKLTESEMIEYAKCSKIFKDYIISKNLSMRNLKDFEKIIMLSGRDKKAREALLSRNRAERIAYNARNKLKKIQELLHKEDRTIIFTRYNDMVYEISKRFFIPCITYRTDSQEREMTLKKFRNGTYSAVVTSQVLDEGIDVPEANIGIIMSGTGSSREFTQRLGRLLRPKGNKKAVLYELVTAGTKEVQISYRRKK